MSLSQWERVASGRVRGFCHQRQLKLLPAPRSLLPYPYAVHNLSS